MPTDADGWATFEGGMRVRVSPRLSPPSDEDLLAGRVFVASWEEVNAAVQRATAKEAGQ